MIYLYNLISHNERGTCITSSQLSKRNISMINNYEWRPKSVTMQSEGGLSDVM